MQIALQNFRVIFSKECMGELMLHELYKLFVPIDILIAQVEAIESI